MRPLSYINLSYLRASPRAFPPIPLIITEPAVGYGLGATALFLRPRQEAGEEGWARPNASVLGGFATQNGTWMAMGGDASRWLDGRLRSLAGAGVGKINLDFYGRNGAPADTPVGYTLDLAGAMVQADWTLAPRSPWSVGLRYAFADVQPKLRDAPSVPVLEDLFHVRVSAPTGVLTYDSRDNVLTPTRGLYAETSYMVSRKDLGSSKDFEEFTQTLIGWLPLASRWTLAARADYQTASLGTPFFMQPFVGLRGVPAMRYQGDKVTSGEVEATWQFHQRWSAVAFVGSGRAENDRQRVSGSQGVTSGGIGLRYELARKFGLHAGLDLAFSPGTSVVIIQVGSAWARP